MKVDYSYVEIFLNAIDKKASLDDLRINEAYKTIQFHADKTGNSFGVEDIERALNGISDQAYGLRNLTRNIHRIRSLYQALVNQEETWLKEVESSLESLFDLTEYKKTTIYPVIGYDIG